MNFKQSNYAKSFQVQSLLNITIIVIKINLTNKVFVVNKKARFKYQTYFKLISNSHLIKVKLKVLFLRKLIYSFIKFRIKSPRLIFFNNCYYFKSN